MTLKVGDNNLVTAEASTITALDEDSLYPVSNLAFNSLQPEYRTDGQRMRFNASEFAYILDGSQSGLDFSTVVACEIMFWTDNISGTEQLLTKWTGGGNLSYRFMRVNDELHFEVSDDGTTNPGHSDIFQTSTANLAVDTMYVWRVLWVGATKQCQMTLNSQQIFSATGTNVASIFNGAGTFMIGARNTVASPLQEFDGVIRYAKIGTTFATPTSEWLMDWTGTVLTDSIGSNDLTTVNATSANFTELPVGYIDIDFGSAKSPDRVMLTRYNTLGSFTDGSIWLELRRDNTNTRWVNLERVVDLTATTGRAIVEDFTAPATASQYARLYFTNFTPTNTFSIIYSLFVGTDVEFDTGFDDNAGYQFGKFRVNSANANTIGNLRTYVKSELTNNFSGSLRALVGNLKSSNDDYQRLLTISEEASQNIPLFWTLVDANSDYEETHTFLAYWTNALDFVNQTMRTSPTADDETWDVAIELQELALEVQT
jgi:hypothetical protein